MSRLPRLCATCFLVVVLTLPGWAAARFAVFAPGQSEAEVRALAEMLEPNASDGVVVAKDFVKAVESDAEVLVLFLPDVTDFSAVNIEPLKKRKVIGIGYSAEKLFDALGLELHGSVHDALSARPEIQIEKNLQSGKPVSQTFVAFDFGDRPRPRGPGMGSLLGIHLPAFSAKNRFVEPIASSKRDPRYAPIARQGNYILSGVVAPTTLWTPEFRSFFHELAAGLAKAASVPFARATWEITQPGTYELDLTRDGTTTDESGKTFYFRFGKPATFKASLEHEGSKAVMLTFYGRKMQNWNRRDARGETAGAPLHIKADISQRDIDKAGEDYWTLTVTNFDRMNPVRCRLKIEYP